MTWELALPLIARYGPQFVLELLSVIEAHPTVDREALSKVLILSQKSMEQYLAEAQERAKALVAQATQPPAS